jgi:two-component system OmpR family response regulator
VRDDSGVTEPVEETSAEEIPLGIKESLGTIVVIEDDENIAELVNLYLVNAGFRVLLAKEAHTGMDLIANERPLLVLMDIGLPGQIDGLEACRQIRKKDSVPIIVITARGDEADRIFGLELGADDYVTKPFSPRELVARVKTILRRTDGLRDESSEVRSIGSLALDPMRRELKMDGQLVVLTAREFDLLEFFLSHTGIVHSRRQLLDGVWGRGWFGDDRTVDVHVRQLRRKLGDAFPLTTVWGVGYRCD